MRVYPDFDTVSINKNELFCEAKNHTNDRLYITAYYVDGERDDLVIIGVGGEHVNGEYDVSMSHNDSAKMDEMFKENVKTVIRLSPMFFVGLLFVGVGIAKVIFL